jgi:PAS domain S-box-containing protein
MAATVHSALDAVIVADANGRILEFNEQACECFGYTREFAFGSLLSDLIIPEPMRKAHESGMKRYLDTGVANIIGKRIEINALHANGHEFPVELAVGAAHKDDAPIFVAYARDISERRAKEEELKSAHAAAQAGDQAKSRFLAVMSHEMRTPLNGVLGIIELLRNTNLDDRQLEMLTTASNSGEVLLDLINDVLDISKMEAGKLHLNSFNFEFKRLPKKVKQIVEVHAEQRGNKIVVETDDQIPTYLHGDGKRLQQVILNLVSNANKFTKQGRITVSSKLVGRSDSDARISIAVSDTGIGIPDDVLPNLFAEFTTVDNSYKRRQGGTGLGLAICKHLIELMGGSIHVESKVGEGSRFCFKVPLPIVDPEVGIDQEADEMLYDELNYLPASILLAEDNPTNAMVAASMLRDAGHSVTVVSDGSEAVKSAQSNRFDVILMDISMPELDGLEATKLIRSMPEPHGDIPIIAMTAHALAGDRERFMSTGMQAYLTKPIRRNELLSTIQSQIVEVNKKADPAESNLGSTEDAPVILDTGELDQLASEIGGEHLQVVICQFADDTNNRTQSVREAEQERDLEKLKKSAHALAGSAATVGANCLADISRRIEAACVNEDFSSALELIPDLLDAEISTIRACAEYLGKPTASQDPGEPEAVADVA